MRRKLMKASEHFSIAILTASFCLFGSMFLTTYVFGDNPATKIDNELYNIVSIAMFAQAFASLYLIPKKIKDDWLTSLVLLLIVFVVCTAVAMVSMVIVGTNMPLLVRELTMCVYVANALIFTGVSLKSIMDSKRQRSEIVA